MPPLTRPRHHPVSITPAAVGLLSKVHFPSRMSTIHPSVRFKPMAATGQQYWQISQRHCNSHRRIIYFNFWKIRIVYNILYSKQIESEILSVTGPKIFSWGEQVVWKPSLIHSSPCDEIASSEWLMFIKSIASREYRPLLIITRWLTGCVGWWRGDVVYVFHTRPCMSVLSSASAAVRTDWKR